MGDGVGFEETWARFVPLVGLDRVTPIMSQRSLFNHSSGNIFYEAIRIILKRLTKTLTSDMIFQ